MPETDEREHAIALPPSVTRKLHFINSSQLQLNATLGQLPEEEQERVIVGVVDLTLEVEPFIDDKTKPPFSVELKLPIENTAYLLADMLSDFANVCTGLARFASKETAPADDRMQLVSFYLDTMKKSIARAEAALEDMPVLKTGGKAISKRAL